MDKTYRGIITIFFIVIPPPPTTVLIAAKPPSRSLLYSSLFIMLLVLEDIDGMILECKQTDSCRRLGVACKQKSGQHPGIPGPRPSFFGAGRPSHLLHPLARGV